MSHLPDPRRYGSGSVTEDLVVLSTKAVSASDLERPTLLAHLGRELAGALAKDDEARIRSALAALPDETVLCRCENRTVGELRILCGGADGLTGREVKHHGRFAMGSCQGRFCADNTAALMAHLRPDLPAPQARDLTGTRWPIRPVPIAALAASGGGQAKEQEI